MVNHIHRTEALFSFMRGGLISVMLESTLQGSQNMSRKMLKGNVTQCNTGKNIKHLTDKDMTLEKKK